MSSIPCHSQTTLHSPLTILGYLSRRESSWTSCSTYKIWRSIVVKDRTLHKLFVYNQEHYTILLCFESISTRHRKSMKHGTIPKPKNAGEINKRRGDISTFFHNIGSFLSLGERRWSRKSDATTQGSCSPVILLALTAFSSSTSHAYHFKRDQRIRNQPNWQKIRLDTTLLCHLGWTIFFLNLSMLLFF